MTRIGIAALISVLAAQTAQGQRAGLPGGTGAALRAAGSAGLAPGPEARATIMGSVWTGENQPVPDAIVRLRHLQSGHVEATTRSDAAGRFQFDRIEGGNYVIEVVNEKGDVRAVGHPLAVAPGETVATFVRLGTRLPWFSGIFSNAATAAVTTAAGLGVTAIAPTGEPLSPDG